MAVTIIIFFSWINYRGIRWGATTQDFFTMGALVILIIFIFIFIAAQGKINMDIFFFKPE